MTTKKPAPKPLTVEQFIATHTPAECRRLAEAIRAGLAYADAHPGERVDVRFNAP